ncbi:MAG: AEC family transporter [Maricaulaceae bacterium]|nr:AEC family transporter [Maricaulaceae bacterium]
MNALLTALVPIGALIALGWALRRSNLVPENLWGGVSRLSYIALMPAFLFSVISRADYSELTAGAFMIAAVLGFAAMGALALALKPLLPRLDGPAFTSLFQGAVRWNGIVILAIAAEAFGLEGAALVALIFLPTIPLINVMCVWALSVWGAGAAPDWRSIGFRILANPLILGCAAGAAANASGLFQSGYVADTADIIGRAALPLILLSIGAGLDFSALRAKPGVLALAVAMKLAAAPLVFFAFGVLLGVEGVALSILTLTGASPAAAAAYVLAREMGGDARLTAGHVTATTVLAFATLPLALALAARFGG